MVAMEMEQLLLIRSLTIAARCPPEKQRVCENGRDGDGSSLSLNVRTLRISYTLQSVLFFHIDARRVRINL